MRITKQYFDFGWKQKFTCFRRCNIYDDLQIKVKYTDLGLEGMFLGLELLFLRKDRYGANEQIYLFSYSL